MGPPRLKKRKTRRQRGGSNLVFHIVYSAYLDTKGSSWENSRAKALVTQQLQDLVDFGLTQAKSIHIILTAPKKSDYNNSTDLLFDEAVASIKSILPSAIIERIAGNKYEYPGIRRVWDLANKTQEDADKTLILYFHSKGMINGNTSSIKTPEAEMLTNAVIKPWKEIIDRFQKEPTLNKAGYAAPDAGFIWYNFWWARASYLKGCPRPILTERRHYYEDWLGRRKVPNNTSPEPGKSGTAANCLSLCVSGPNGPLGMSMSASMEKCTV